MELVISMEDIPDDLVINFDQTGIRCIPVSDWTMAREGAKRVEIAGKNDKSQPLLAQWVVSFYLHNWFTRGNDTLPAPL